MTSFAGVYDHNVPQLLGFVLIPSSLKNKIDESGFQSQIPREISSAPMTQVLIQDGTGIGRLWEGHTDQTAAQIYSGLRRKGAHVVLQSHDTFPTKVFNT